jgi:hypothetical protein
VPFRRTFSNLRPKCQLNDIAIRYLIGAMPCSPFGKDKKRHSHAAKADRGPVVFLTIVVICLSCFSPPGCLGQTGSGAASDPASTVTVDASAVVAESDSGDDLATVQNIFQDANAPQDGTIVPMQPIISDLKMKRMRILQGDVYCDLDGNGNFGTVPFDQNGTFGPVVPGECDFLATQIKWALDNGLSPHVAVASTLPVSFAQYGPAETWSNDVLNRYKSYAYQLVSYILRKSFDANALNGGAASVIFEVSNELDIADPAPLNFYASTPPDPSQFALLPLGPWGRFLWWIDPATYNLREWPPVSNSYPYSIDLRRVARGISPVQKIFGDVVQAIRSDPGFQASYPGKTVQIAGPAFSGVSFQYINFEPTERPTLEEHFLDQLLDPNSEVDPNTNLARFNSSLDYFSFHYYGDFRGGWAPQEPRYTTTLKYVTDRIRSKLTALGHPETRLFLSEWGPTVDESTDINYSHKGAAWAAAFLTEAVADRIAMGSYLIMHDAVGFQPATIGQASLMDKIVTEAGAAYYPKPPANVFKMFAMMTGTRRPVTLPAASSNLGAFAASGAHSAGIIVFNYNSAFTDTPETFSVELDNLPLDGAVTVERYLVDANTSNLEAFLLQPGHPDPSLQKVEQFSAQVQNGQLILPSRSLGLGVTFWRVLS